MIMTSVPIQNEDARSVRLSPASGTIERKSLFPIQIVMVGPIAVEWELIKPLELSVDRDSDGSYLVSDDIFNVFGEGITASESVLDYLASLIEYHRLISRHDDAPTQALCAALGRYLRAR